MATRPPCVFYSYLIAKGTSLFPLGASSKRKTMFGKQLVRTEMGSIMIVTLKFVVCQCFHLLTWIAKFGLSVFWGFVLCGCNFRQLS